MTAALHDWTLAELGERIGRREVSPVAVTEHMLARIERLDPALHAYVTVTADLALSQAREAEREIGAGRRRGALHGVPIALKDLCDVAGVRTTVGTRVMADRVAERDATVTARLREAGAVFLGKLAMTEGAYSEHHPDYARPVNPWNAAAWTGVSSSGSGVATAARLCFAALGSDTGGSIRFPSAMNGLVGIKPTYGRVPVAGVFPMAASLDHVGPMCRSVLDAALVLDVIAGGDDRDPTSATAAVSDYAAAARDGAAGRSRPLDGLRVGIDRRYGAEGLDDEIVAAVFTAVDVLRMQGADVRAVEVPAVDELVARWGIVCGAEMLVAHEPFFPSRADDYGPALRWFLELALGLPASELARTHLARLAFCGRLARLFETVDVLVTPTVGVHLPATVSVLDPEALAAMSLAMRFTAPFNFTGSPTISVPCGFTRAGVPVSVQLVGRHFEEAALIRAAAAYERATDWHRARPPAAE